ncbi:sulfite exporter TauE/SafE family protein [Nonomuraea sp. G32]|nr:sulfite exporter TauE/SafE family protein [Nonomuraea sp. G32]MDP4510226.1 sulfite exporter TauE/SafE family protein [Nonomuraea sp. G32]
MALLQLGGRRHDGKPERPPGRLYALAGRAAPFTVGVIAGFATMTANAAGPVMTMYLLMAGLPVLGLLGTGAWFFFLVNLAKVPFSAGLELIDGATVLLDLALVPPLLVGAAVGARLANKIPRRRFEDITMVLTVMSAATLLL